MHVLDRRGVDTFISYNFFKLNFWTNRPYHRNKSFSHCFNIKNLVFFSHWLKTFEIQRESRWWEHHFEQVKFLVVYLFLHLKFMLHDPIALLCLKAKSLSGFRVLCKVRYGVNNCEENVVNHLSKMSFFQNGWLSFYQRLWLFADCVCQRLQK